MLTFGGWLYKDMWLFFAFSITPIPFSCNEPDPLFLPSPVGSPRFSSLDGFAVSQHRRGAGVLFHVELTPLLPNPEITVCTARVTRMTETFWVNTTISEFGIRFRKLQCHVCGNGLYSSTVPLALTSLQEEGANLALTLQEVAGLPVC